MVEVNVTVCCPVCEEKIELNKKFCQLSSQQGLKSEIYSTTEFERHMDTHSSFKNHSSSQSGLSTCHADKLKRNQGEYSFATS